MVCTVEEIAAYNKAYREANKIELAASKKAYYEANKVEIAARQKIFRDSHKAEKADWYQANKVKISIRKKVLRETPNGVKKRTIIKWKWFGLIHDNYEELYESYLQSTHCNACKNEYKNTFDRCMDHDHTTNQFRQFLCRSCNSWDNWKTLI